MKEKYQPLPEEKRRAEDMMSEEQKQLSAARDEGYRLAETKYTGGVARQGGVERRHVEREVSPEEREQVRTPEELLSMTSALQGELYRARFNEGVEQRLPHVAAAEQLLRAASTLLDESDQTPEALEFAYGKIRAALGMLGFTFEREVKRDREETERIEDQRWLKEHGLRRPDEDAQ